MADWWESDAPANGGWWAADQVISAPTNAPALPSVSSVPASGVAAEARPMRPQVWADGTLADFPDPDAPATVTPPPQSLWDRAKSLVTPAPGEMWSPLSIPGVVSGIWNGVKSAATLPSDLMSGKIDVNDPRQAVANAGRFLNAAAIVSPMGPEAIGARLVAPSADPLYNAASQGFSAWNKSGVTVAPSSVAQAAAAIKDGLINDDFLIPETAPRTHALLEQLANPPAGALPVRAADLDAARKKLVELGQDTGAEGVAARKAKSGLLGYMQNIPSLDVASGADEYPAARQQLADAIGNWAAGSRVGTLENLGENAELRAAAANSGKNIGNATRQRLATLIQNPPSNPTSPSIAARSGFNPDEINAIQGVVQGDALSNTARGVSNFLGGGGGLGRMLTTGAGAGLGHVLGVGPEVGALVGYEASHAFKGVENAAVTRALRKVQDTVAQRSPLYQSGAGPQEAVFPTTQNALVRALMSQQGYSQQQ